MLHKQNAACVLHELMTSSLPYRSSPLYHIGKKFLSPVISVTNPMQYRTGFHNAKAFGSNSRKTSVLLYHSTLVSPYSYALPVRSSIMRANIHMDCAVNHNSPSENEFLRRSARAKSIILQVRTRHSDASYATVIQPLLVLWSLKESSIYCLAAWETFCCPWGSLNIVEMV